MPANLRTLTLSGFPLGVECPCGRRVLVESRTLGAHDGNMKELASLKLKCSACGSRPKELRLFYSQKDVDDWIGAPIGRPSF